MITIDAIRNYYPEPLRNQAAFTKYILKEYIQLLVLDYLSSSPYLSKLAFIGGTSIRLIKGIDRFSEDLDFDCNSLTREEFNHMTDDVVRFLHNNGLKVETRDTENTRLKAFRRNLYFPGFLYDLGISGHRDERFLIKIECQDQSINYKTEMIHVKGCGFFFPMVVPPAGVLCAMKVSAMLDRRKGRDFYDTMFLLSQNLPDFQFLAERTGIGSLQELKETAAKVISSVDLSSKMKDFEHLLFNRQGSTRILMIGEFIDSL